MGLSNLISFIGIFIILFIAWIFSNNKKNINWRLLFWGIGIQLTFAIFIFRLPLGINIFNWLNSTVIKFLSFAQEGAYFIFGPLAVSPGTVGPNSESSLGFILAFQALPTLIFFSALMALLYHFRIMQLAIRIFSRVFTKLMRVSGAESLCAASNIFVGVESALTIRPYLNNMTLSELCTVLTVGMATIASTVLALYVSFLKIEFPLIAGHLISASILSAPAAIVISKLFFPEDKTPQTLGKFVYGQYLKSDTWIEAIIRGANEGIKLCAGIIALLLAILGLLAMLNWFLTLLGNSLGRAIGFNLDLSLTSILKYPFSLFALIIGAPIGDASVIGKLLGDRIITTELVAYKNLASLINSGVIKNPRSIVLASYALCGFSHIASLAIFTGGLTALVPERAKDLSRLGLRSLFAANLSCLLTASVAGVFFYSQSILF